MHPKSPSRPRNADGRCAVRRTEAASLQTAPIQLGSFAPSFRPFEVHFQVPESSRSSSPLPQRANCGHEAPRSAWRGTHGECRAQLLGVMLTLSFTAVTVILFRQQVTRLMVEGPRLVAGLSKGIEAAGLTLVAAAANEIALK